MKKPLRKQKKSGRHSNLSKLRRLQQGQKKQSTPPAYYFDAGTNLPQSDTPTEKWNPDIKRSDTVPVSGSGIAAPKHEKKQNSTKIFFFRESFLLDIVLVATFIKGIASLYDITKLTSALSALIVGFIFFLDIALRFQAHLLTDEEQKKYRFSLRIAKFSSIIIMCIPIVANYFHHRYDAELIFVLNISKFIILSFMTDLLFKIIKSKPPVL